MLTIELVFPSGRFHATPWGRHVNEGVPEWPPSPYRLIRALYNVWKRKRPDWPQSRVEPLLAALAESPPRFCLPPANSAHTRSFLSQNLTDSTKRQLIFDGFVAVDPESSVLLVWPETTLARAGRGGPWRAALSGQLLGTVRVVGDCPTRLRRAVDSVELLAGRGRGRRRGGDCPGRLRSRARGIPSSSACGHCQEGDP